MRAIVLFIFIIPFFNCKAQSLLANSDSLSKPSAVSGEISKDQSEINITKNLLNSTGEKRKTAYVEFLGNGLGISANIETRLKADRNDGFGIRMGVGFSPGNITLPLGVNYISGKKRSGFETGIGITPFYNIDGYPSDQKLRMAAILNIGYRLQSNNGLMLRLNFSGGRFIENNSSDFLIDFGDGLKLPLPGLSIGYNFNHLQKQQIEKKYLAPVTLNGQYRKSVFVEAIGNGLGISVNYDMRLKPNRNDGLGFRAGLGYLPDYGNSYITIPVGLNYIFGKRKSGIETGIGITGLYSSDPYKNFFYDPVYSGDPAVRFMAAGVFNAGYRYQATKGFMFRAYYTAMYDGLFYTKPFYKDGLVFIAYPGLSIGYSFNKLNKLFK